MESEMGIGFYKHIPVGIEMAKKRILYTLNVLLKPCKSRCTQTKANLEKAHLENMVQSKQIMHFYKTWQKVCLINIWM